MKFNINYGHAPTYEAVTFNLANMECVLKNIEDLLKIIVKMFRRYGFIVRRENLSRGRSFRVRSGNCEFGNEKLVFVDRRLSPNEQISFLIDFLSSAKIQLQPDDFALIPPRLRSVLRTAGRVES